MANTCNNNDNDSGYGESATTETPAGQDDTTSSQELYELPDGTTLLDTQLAGHCFDAEKHEIGMLRGPNGHVFKPIIKPDLGEREIAFYENLRISSNPTDMEVMRFTPTYYGTKEMRIFNRRIKFLELGDITDGMSEPCVMDVKIGRRTWDPQASEEKRAKEELKYVETKQPYGFCVPGFQVYKIPAGNLKRYNKDYGKKLNEKTLVEALENFLNATPNRPPCRDLVVRLLSILWKIQALFREQRRYRVYSSSLLIAYDAKRLRHYMRRQLNNSLAESLLRVPVSRSKTFNGAARSLGSLNKIDRTNTPSPLSSPSTNSVFTFPRPGSPKLNQSSKSLGGFLSPRASSPAPSEPSKLDSPTRSPRVNRAIDRLQRLKRSISLQNCEQLPDKVNVEFAREPFSIPEPKPKRVPDITVQKLCRTHSYSNNFDADIIQMKEDYAALLHELSSTCEEKQNWVRVYMIDFAHVFPADNDDLDNNYLEGVESLIKILEKFIAC